MSLHQDEPQDLSDLIRRARRAAGLTQEELAERAGLSTRGISDLERGIHLSPHTETLNMLMDALGLTEAERTTWRQIRRRSSRRYLSATGDVQHDVHLPVLLTSLIGREQETRVISDMLGDPTIRLVTLTGAGGIGKTRQSIAVADQCAGQFPAGVYFVNLAAIRDPALVVPAIARAISVSESGDAPLLTTLAGFIGERHMLLVLDNFEQIVDAALDVVTLLHRCPNLQVLVTSRVALHVTGEHEYVLPPLQLPEEHDHSDLLRLQESGAVELFVRCAQAIRFGFEMTGANSKSIVSICRRLDGLPLAIELAAARTRILSPQDILSRLEQPLEILTGGPRDLPDRQRTMRATISWSYELLTPHEQRFFRRLSAFVGGWTIEAAAAGTQDIEALDVLDGITALIDFNLVQRQDLPGGETRFTMLEMVREFGLEQVETLGETHHTFHLHAACMLAFTTEAEQAIRDARQSQWFTRMAHDQGNIRAALQRSLVESQVDANIGRQMTVQLVWYWFTNNHFREARDWLQLAVSVTEERADVLWARACVGLGMMRWRLREIPEATTLIEDGLSVLRTSDDHWNTMFAVHQLAHMADEAGNSQEAVRLFRESMRGYDDIPDPWGVAIAHCCLGRTLQLQGSWDEARAVLRHAEETFRALGDSWFWATSAHRLGDVEFSSGNFEQSAGWYRAGLRRSADVGDEIGVADVLVRLGQIAVALDQPERAARLLGAASAIHDDYSMALFEPLRPAYADVIATLVRILGQVRFNHVWEEGRQLALPDAVDLALELDEGQS